MVAKININDLPDEVLERLGLIEGDKRKPTKLIKLQVVAIGGVLLALKGLTNRQALWALRTASILVRGYKTDKGGAHRTKAEKEAENC